MPVETIQPARFTLDFLGFFKQIKENNNKEWFTKNKPRYEASVKGPCLGFIRAVAPGLHKISREIVADPRPVGGSLFRIYRDTRFSKDKSPYKTHAGLHFTHRSNSDKGHFPGFYLHLEPGDSSAWAGVWMPSKESLQAIREDIAARPAVWKKMIDGRERHGDSLKRVPLGFDADHSMADELKRKDFLIGQKFKDSQITAPDFADPFLETCRKMAPYNAALARAMGTSW